MNLRELVRIASATGLTITPVSTRDAEDAVLVLLKVGNGLLISREGVRNLVEGWKSAVRGTPLEGVKTFVLADGIDVEILKAVVKEGDEGG